MDTDAGRGSRSDQPPHATVRRLRLDEYTSRSGAAEDDWYETERLTEQITGGAQGAAATEEPAVTPEPTLVLDWRNPDSSPGPSAAQRLRRGFDRRRRRRVTLRVPRPASWPRRHRRTIAMEVPDTKTHESTTSTEPEAAANRTDAVRPLLGFRHEPEPQVPEAGRALGTRVRERMPQLAWERGASILALTLAGAATATIGIAVALSGSPAKSHRAAAVATSSGQASDFATAAKALTAAAGFVDHQVRNTSTARRAGRAQRARRAVHRRPLGARQHRPKSQSTAPAAAPPPASTASSSGSASSSPVYSGSSSAPSTSSQSVTSEPATSTQHTQSTQPAFGQNGTLGPGRGAPGTQ